MVNMLMFLPLGFVQSRVPGTVPDLRSGSCVPPPSFLEHFLLA